MPLETTTLLMPVLLMLTKLQVSGMQNYGYHLVQYLFPVLIRGQIFGIANFFSRPFAAVSTIVSEYTT